MDPRALIQAAFRYAVSLSHDEAEARDLAQEAWLRASRAYPQVTRSLLFTTLRNLWIDSRRRPRVVVLNDAPDSPQGRAEVSSASGERAALAEALAHLNVEERECLYLSVVEGYTADEIGHVTGTSRNTVLSRLRRGKEKLRESLSEAAPETAARPEAMP